MLLLTRYAFCPNNVFSYNTITVSILQPKSWIPEGDPFGSASVYALDMVSEETSIHRLLAAITGPPKWATNRPWCMQCKSPQRFSNGLLHCQHCGRHICTNCTRRILPPDFFPKSFDVYEDSSVCLICEDILVARKEDFSNSTSATHPASSIAVDDDGHLSLHAIWKKEISHSVLFSTSWYLSHWCSFCALVGAEKISMYFIFSLSSNRIDKAEVTL